jgi:uncharacterized protein (TIGR00297 family)
VQILAAIGFAGAVAVAALRSRALTRTGSLAAWIVGACVFGAGSWRYAAVLFAFFIPSTLLSRFGRARKRALVDIGKSGARDAFQVFANGGVAAFCALLSVSMHNAALAAAFAGAFAAASADTWGTEIGTLVKAPPRSILTLRRIAPGLSGGVTAAGTVAEIGGAFIVALAASALGIAHWWTIAAAGTAGALVDSILGATLQDLRFCPTCKRPCETDPHACGAPTQHIRGAAWVGNDAVNLCATATGALVAALLTH